MNKLQMYSNAIADCEYRVGGYVMDGGKLTDPYVQDQIRKRKEYQQMILNLINDKKN